MPHINYLTLCIIPIAALFIISGVAFIILIHRAPTGYEDDNGWHEGKR